MSLALAAGIIAAGDGTRLQGSHPGLVKPLVPVAGVPLCHWVARGLARAGAQRIFLLHNSRGAAIRASLTAGVPEIKWSFVQKDTASSWESFRLVCQALAQDAPAFLISTVDALIPPAEVARFAREMSGKKAAAGLALTDFIDDEKPLWAELDSQGGIVALGPECRRKELATCGLYYMTAAVARKMPPAAVFSSLRGYLVSLVENEGPIAGLTLSKTIDVDRPQDVEQAENFLREADARW